MEINVQNGEVQPYLNKKAFTLIELLAVIVILAIIALIAVPIVLGVINDSKQSSYERSVELYGKAVQQAITKGELDNHQIKEANYKSSNDGKTLTYTDPSTSTTITINVEYSGNKVECTTNQVYSDGQIYLSGCKVENDIKEYIYGTKSNVHTLTANFNYDSAEKTTQEIIYYETYGNLPVPSREGYTFAGWNTKADGTGEAITSETIVSFLSDQEIYAQWTINQYDLNVYSSVNGNQNTNGHAGFTFDVYVNNSLVADDVIVYNSQVNYNSQVRVELNDKTNYATIDSTIQSTITSDTELIPAWITSNNIGIQFKYENLTLIVITEGKTWEAAETYAQSLGGHLAMIKTAAMQNYVYDTILANPNVANLSSFWIGATDKAKEGDWRWVDGTELSSTYSNWNSGEPNDSSGEDYCQYYISGGTKGKWNDLNGTQTYPFVVQIGN